MLERLVIELCLAGVSSGEQANEVMQAYVPRFNAQFVMESAHVELANRPLSEMLRLDTIFCFTYVQIVALDNEEVELHERLNGSLAVWFAERVPLMTLAPLESPELRAHRWRRVPRRAGRTPRLPKMNRKVSLFPKGKCSSSVPGPGLIIPDASFC